MADLGLRWAVGVAVAGALLASLGSAAALPTAAHGLIRPVVVESERVAAEPLLKEKSICPASMAHVGTTCVDKYEGSLLAIGDDGVETPFSPYEPPNGQHVRAVSRPGVVPQGHISMVEAQRACKASNKRLCHAGEWKAACKGPDATQYPYGNTRVAHACVDTNRRSPMNFLHDGEHTADTLNDPLANQQENTLERTGAAEQCTNGYDVHDMVGNIHEWTDDVSFRGGYYLDTKLNGEGCDYRTTRHYSGYYDYSTGFRCCADENADVIE